MSPGEDSGSDMDSGVMSSGEDSGSGLDPGVMSPW